MLLFYRQKEDAIVIVFEKDRIMPVIKWRNRDKSLGLNAKNNSTRIHTFIIDNKRENTRS
jgi:hypothetical protein